MEEKLSIIDKINDTIAIFITNIVGTMWCAYAFAILVIIPLIFPSTSTVIQYISSAFLQLVLLPLLMVGSTVLNRSSELRAKRDHKILKEELVRIRELSQENDLIIQMLTKVKGDIKLEINISASPLCIAGTSDRLLLCVSSPKESLLTFKDSTLEGSAVCKTNTDFAHLIS